MKWFFNNFLSVAATCLLNTPASTSFENVTKPGQWWTADDQCKMIYGSSASFCVSQSNLVCSALPCRTTNTDNTCVYTYGYAAADGTTCSSGNVTFSFFIYYYWLNSIISYVNHWLQISHAPKMLALQTYLHRRELVFLAMM